MGGSTPSHQIYFSNYGHPVVALHLVFPVRGKSFALPSCKLFLTFIYESGTQISPSFDM